MKKTTLLVLGLIFLSSCQLGYYFNSATNQLSLIARRQPVSKMLESSDLTTEQKRKLQLSQLAREFAFTDVHLTRTQNYDTYIDLRRPYITWVVNAAEKWEFKNYEWDFLFFGKAPYKGFYSEKEANEEAEILRRAGLDTHVRGVAAFSMLGKIKDSVLSSMLRYKDHDLVNTIIHESVHATLYIKDNADFNERMAMFIAAKGTELFYRKLEGADSPTLKTIEAENEDDRLFSQFISDQIKLLKEWYKTNTAKDETLRQAQFQKIKDAFQAQLSHRLKTKGYQKFPADKMNNATLGLMSTYMEDLSDFEKLYAKSGSDLKLFLEKLMTLEDSEDPVADLKKLAE